MDCINRRRNVFLLNTAFTLWLFSEFMFEYSLFSRLSLLLFVGLAIVCTKGRGWSGFLTGYLLMALWSVCNIVTGQASDRRLAADMTQTLFLNLLFLYALVCYCYYIGDLGKILEQYKTVILLCGIPCFLGLSVGTMTAGQRMLHVFGMNVNSVAMHGAYVAIILMYELLTGENKTARRRHTIQLLFLLAMILLTGSRKGLLIPAIGGYVLICFQNPRRILRYTAAALLAAALILILIFHVEFLYHVIGHRVEAVFLYMNGQNFQEASLHSRLRFIHVGWEGFLRKPVMGYGLDCFRLERYAYGTYSHNNYIELLYSLGFVGTALYYLPFAGALKRLLTSTGRQRNAAPLFAALLVQQLFSNFFSVDYFTRISLMLPLLSILLSESKGDKHGVYETEAYGR